MVSILIVVVNSMVYAFIKHNLILLLKHKLQLNKVDLIFLNANIYLLLTIYALIYGFAYMLLLSFGDFILVLAFLSSYFQHEF